MVEISPGKLVDALFHELGLNGLVPEVDRIEDHSRSRSVLLPFSATVQEPVRVYAQQTATGITLGVERTRILISGVDSMRILRDGNSIHPRLCASATLDWKAGRMTLRKAAVEGSYFFSDAVAYRAVTTTNPDEVVRQMVQGVLEAAGLDRGSQGMKWDQEMFRYRRLIPPASGAVQLGCWLCVVSASVLFGVFAFRSLTQVTNE